MTKTQISDNKNQLVKLLPVFATALLVIGIGLAVSCTNKTDPYSIIKLNGKGECYNFSKYWGYMLNPDSSCTTSMLLGKGDLLALGEGGVFFPNSDEKTINFEEKPPFFYVNGKITSISISNDTDLIGWFKQMKPDDISDLKAILFNSEIPENYYPYLSKIAHIKPHASLFFKDKCKIDPEMLKLFSPRYLIGQKLLQKDYNLLAGFKDLEVLSLGLDDSIINVPLPYLPKLKQVILLPDSKSSIASSFLKNNSQIEKLTLTADQIDLTFIKLLKNLKECSFVGSKETTNLNFLKQFKKLEVLRLVGDNYNNINIVNELPNLRWLALPKNTSQQEFNSIIANHKNLEVLEILACDSVKSFKSLAQLNNLYGLIITHGGDSTILSLKNLKYLSLPKDDFEDGAKIASLHKSLPGCTIVPNEGFCLGSGWLLLLIPFILIFRLMMRNIKPAH